jgi:hypothetical protein
MKNPTARSAPRAGFPIDNGSNASRNLLEMTTSSQVADSLESGIGVASFWKSPRNRTEAIQISLRQYEGHPYPDARVYAMNATGHMVPTPRGIAVAIKTLPQFVKGIGDAYRKAVALGLITTVSS